MRVSRIVRYPRYNEGILGRSLAAVLMMQNRVVDAGLVEQEIQDRPTTWTGAERFVVAHDSLSSMNHGLMWMGGCVPGVKQSTTQGR